jgi:hypothetical protein
MVEPLGRFERVETTSWTFQEGRGTLEGRLVFHLGALEARIDVAFEPHEGRVVVTRLDVHP